MSKPTLPLLVVSVALVAAACGSAAVASPPPSTGPSPSSGPAITPEPSGVDHPTGATDVVLRMDVGGGFMPIDFAASQAPTFTLFGDGRIVFQPKLEVFPQPDSSGITRFPAWRTGQLDGGQIEELLTFALGPGGLGTARDSYIEGGIADAANTIFTINAGGLTKTVLVNAIEMEPSGGPDDAARQALKRLADRLSDFDAGGTLASEAYAPTSYRAVLVEREPDPAIPQPTAAPWPWPALKLTDFPTDVNGVGGQQFPHRTLTTDEVGALGLGDVGGVIQGLTLKGPDGKTYSLILRALLPDETS
jgi:hypothetical protein